MNGLKMEMVGILQDSPLTKRARVRQPTNSTTNTTTSTNTTIVTNTTTAVVAAPAVAPLVAKCIGSGSNDSEISSIFFYGGVGTTVNLCPGAKILLTGPIFFYAAKQTLQTQGLPVRSFSLARSCSRR